MARVTYGSVVVCDALADLQDVHMDQGAIGRVRGTNIAYKYDGSDWIAEEAGGHANTAVAHSWHGTHPINVKASPYNAIGDGVADDTAAFSAAFTDTQGKRLVIPTGTYLVDPDVLALTTAGTNIEGESDETSGSIIKARSTGAALLRVSAQGCTIRNLRLDGDSKATYGLVLHRGLLGMFEKVSAIKAITANFFFNISYTTPSGNNDSSTFLHCTAGGSSITTYGWLVPDWESDNNNISFIDCFALQHTSDGMRFRGNSNRIIGGNYFANSGYGIHLMADATHLSSDWYLLAPYLETNTLGGIRFNEAVRCVHLMLGGGTQSVDFPNSRVGNSEVDIGAAAVGYTEFREGTDGRGIQLSSDRIVLSQGSDTNRDLTFIPKGTGGLRLGQTGNPAIKWGAGSPEGVITAPVGSIFVRTDGGVATSVYVKESGGNTGWAALGHVQVHTIGGADHTGTLPNDHANTEAVHSWHGAHHTAFVQADHDGLPNPHHSNANDHAQSHILATGTALGPDQTISGAAAGEVLRALSPTTAAFDVLQHTDLGGVTATQHHSNADDHAAAHAIDGANHTGTLLDTQIPASIARDSELHAALHSIIGVDHNGFPGGTTNFLRADGTFAAPPGGGGGLSVTLVSGASGAANTTAAPSETWQVLTADGTNATTTLAAGITTTGLAIGTYQFKYYMRYRSSATTTGVKWGLDYTGTVTSILSRNIFAVEATAASSLVADSGFVGTAAGIGTFIETRADNLTIGPTASVDTADADMLWTVEGLLIVSTAANLVLNYAAETVGTISLMTGSNLRLMRLA